MKFEGHILLAIGKAKIRRFFMMKRVCIVGIGWLGEELAVALKKLGHHVIGTTTSASKVEVLERKIDSVKVFNLNNVDVNFLTGCDVLIYTIPPSSSDKYAEISNSFLGKVLKLILVFRCRRLSEGLFIFFMNRTFHGKSFTSNKLDHEIERP